MRINDVECGEKHGEQPNKFIASDLDRPNEEIKKSTVVSDVTTPAAIFDADDDGDPPKCERHQFAQYIMSTISELPESRAEQAMQAIQLFLQKWPGYVAADT